MCAFFTDPEKLLTAEEGAPNFEQCASYTNRFKDYVNNASTCVASIINKSLTVILSVYDDSSTVVLRSNRND